jgi:hypothetical protein
MLSITEAIDKRISNLIILRGQAIVQKDTNAANQFWARLEELKSLKAKFSDKSGWLI